MALVSLGCGSRLANVTAKVRLSKTIRAIVGCSTALVQRFACLFLRRRCGMALVQTHVLGRHAKMAFERGGEIGCCQVPGEMGGLNDRDTIVAQSLVGFQSGGMF